METSLLKQNMQHKADMPVELDRERISRLLGKRGGSVSRRLSRKIDECIKDVSQVVRPRIVYATRTVSHAEYGSLELDGDVVLQSAKLSKTLGKCNEATVFLATLGSGVDELVQSALDEQRFSDASIYDAIGSAAVEGVVDDFQRSMDQAMAKDDRKTTLRFSPGYCDWKIHDQQKLFKVLNNDLIDVELSDSCLMKPRKSVSGVFGIGESGHINDRDNNPCKTCGMRNCIARRG